MYERLRFRYTPDDVAPSKTPSQQDVETVVTESVRAKPFENFFIGLCADGELDRSMVLMTRRLIARRGRTRAVSIFQALQRYDDLRPLAEICLALCALDHPMPETAWAFFARNDLGLVLRWAADEYFALGFELHPERAVDALRRTLDGEYTVDVGPESWLNIAYASFAAGQPDLSGAALQRAEAGLPNLKDRARLRELRARTSNLRGWLDRATAAAQPSTAAEGEISFALAGSKHPDWREISTDLSDPIDTLATFGQLLRHQGVAFTGDEKLVAVAERLAKEVAPEQRIDGGKTTVRLCEIERDMSRYAAVPDGTWLIVSDWLRAPLPGRRSDMPLDPKLRPIFISFHITPRSLSRPGAVEYLRKYGPIGCRDWDTVFLLNAAGVPAFFSGALTMTLDSVVPRRAGARATSETVFVDARSDGPGKHQSRLSPAVRRRDLSENLTAAAEALGGYRDGAARVVTSDLRLFLALRAVGCPAKFRPSGHRSYRFVDYVKLPNDSFRELQRGVSDKLAAVLGAVLAGRSEAEVYETWRELCATEVAAAEAKLRAPIESAHLAFDLAEACRVVRTEAVVVERSDPGPGGAEINIEFSLDANYKHQLDIVLDSVVEHASRPVRAFLLCRGHGQEDFDRMARLFPTVSFVWLPTDKVDYGRIGGMNSWVTPATMDRTIMPALLDDVDKIIHFDLDALCFSDIAELFDVDMEGTAIAAATSPQSRFVSGYETFRRNAERLRQEKHPELARELILRTHARHPFDFDVFNAGVMLLDLAKMREDDFCGRTLPYVQRFGLNGQVVLNAYVGRDRKVVGNEWNRLIRLEADETRKACHWVGQFKPWRSDMYVTGRELWRAQEEHFKARTAHRKAVAEPVS
ncbi:MAG TPA: glycosyltransferase [Jatrophihabitans sp.]|nr:glycosyltransferase [Jatrophihabitans sp.]